MIVSEAASAPAATSVARVHGTASVVAGLIARRSRPLLSFAIASVAIGWGTDPALAEWRPATATKTSIAYNNGVTFDQARGNFFFDGVSSTTNSGLYRTNSTLAQTAAAPAVIPSTAEGYNHVGDLSFDPFSRRLLLPLECYYPNRGGNTCRTGAIGVVDPVTLRFRYYVNLARSQITKAMWDEISPDGGWIWTSSGTHLLAYRAASINPSTARRQRQGKNHGILGIDLGSVLPSSGVTGATFFQDPRTGIVRLLLSLNLGTRFEVVSLGTATGSGRPRLLNPHATTIIKMARSALNDEPEGLAVTPRSGGRYPLGGQLHWQMLPTITHSTIFSRILSFVPVAAPDQGRG
jgi:hypothetical protein